MYRESKNERRASLSFSHSLMADSDFPVFIDTNLDTHFAFSISPQETVADLKGKIRTEHAVCFPDIGEITVLAMKIRRKASFYHLTDNMFIRSAFEGVKRSLFLHLDIVSTTSVMKTQAEAVRNITNENRLENCYLLKTEYNNSPAESPILDGSQTLPLTLSKKLATQASPSLPSTHSCKKLQLNSNVQDVSGNKDIDAVLHLNVQEDNVNGKSGVPASEIDSRTDALQKSEEPVTKDKAVVGSEFEEKEEVINDQVKKDEREGASIISSKKEKARERDRTLLNDQLLKGTLQQPSARKKKRKKENDGSLKPVGDQVTGHIFDSGTYNKGSSDLEMVLPNNSPREKHETNLVSSEELPSKPSYVDSMCQSPVDNEQKKRRKKHQTKVYPEFPQSRLAGPSVKEMDADIRKQAAEGNDEEFLVTNYANLEKPTNPAYFLKENTQKMIDGNNVEVGTIKPSTKHIGSDYTKERLTRSTKNSKQLPSEEVSNVNPESQLDGNLADMQKDSSDALVPYKNEDPRDQPEIDPGALPSSRRSRKKHKSERLSSSKNESLHSAVEHVNEEKVEEPVGNHNYLSKESDTVTTRRSHQNRRKTGNKADSPNLLPNTCKNMDSSAGHITLENPNEISGGHLGHTGKKSEEDTVFGEAAAVVSSPIVDAIATSTSNDKKPKHSRKKSGKAKLPGHMASEAVHVFLKENDKLNTQEPLEDISKGKAGGDHEHVGKESKVAAVSGEVAANVALYATLDSTIPSNSKDKRSKCSRKKSGNIELGGTIMSEADPSILQEDGKEPKEPLEDIFNGKSGDDFDQHNKESEGTSVSGEVAGQLDSALVVSTTSLYPNDKKPKHSRKKSGKSVLPREFLKEVNKVTEEEKLKKTLADNKTLGQESKSAIIRTEATPLEGIAEDSTATLNTTHKRTRAQKKSSNAEVVYHSSRRNTCSENEHTDVNLEKEVASTNGSSGSGFKAGINPDETAQHMKYSKRSKIDETELFNDSSDKHETSQVSTENVTEESTKALSEKAPEGSGKRTIYNASLQGSAELIEANHHMELTKADNDNNNFRHYFPKMTQLPVLPAHELPYKGTETKETNKELARKRKPQLTSEYSTHLLGPSVSDEHDMPTVQNSNGNSGLVNPSRKFVSEELKPGETRKKGAVKKKHKTDVHSHNTSSELVSPKKLHDDSGKKSHISDSHQEVSKSMDKKTNHAEEKNNSMNTLRKLQSPPGSECSDSSREDTHYKEKRCRVAVRKISSKRYSKGTNQSTQRNTSLDSSPTIFNDAISESSEDKFEINDRETSLKAGLDNSSASSDSDGDLGGTKRTGLHETQTYMNSPEANVYHQNDKEMDVGRSILPRSSKVKKKGMPLSEILKKTSNFKKAKSTASQSEFDDSESQPVEDIVLET